MSHYEWEQVKKGNSWKVQVRESIDAAILKCRNFSEFKDELRKYGIEILEGKYLTFHKIGVESKTEEQLRSEERLLARTIQKKAFLKGFPEKREKKHRRLSGN